MNFSLQASWRQPLFSSILNERAECAAIAGFGVVHIGLNALGLPFWSCPILAATGVPCPGCGLTRATIQLLHGDFSASLQTHAFAPFFLAALILMVATMVSPEGIRKQIVTFIRQLETQRGLTAWFFLIFILYWVFRLMA